MPDKRHSWLRLTTALEMECQDCDYILCIRHLARMGWDIDDEDQVYTALGGSDLFSNGCCPRRVN